MINKIFNIKKNETHVNIKVLGIKIKFRQRKKAVAFLDCGGIGDYMLLRQYLK